jgi:ATP-dependent DNA helicase PIF1
MRLLLTVQYGCCSLQDIKTVEGIVYKSFRKACFVLGLLCDNKEFVDGIKEGGDLATSS